MKTRQSLVGPSGVILACVCVTSAHAAEIEPKTPASQPTAIPPILPLIRTPDFSNLAAYDVVRVRAADSVVVRIGQRDIAVRFLGVEAYAPPPEAAARARVFSRQAAVFLGNLLLGEKIYMVADLEEGAGASAVYVYRAPDGLFVNAELIRAGYARAYSARAYQHRDAFVAYERNAARVRKGLWALPASPAGGPVGTVRPDQGSDRASPPRASTAVTPPRPAGPATVTPRPQRSAERRRTKRSPELVGDKQSFIYHGPVCRLRSRIVFPQKIKSPRDAVIKGYRPCRICKPPR